MREASTEPTQTKKAMAEVRSSVELRGCIKNSKGPWVVRRTTKKGLVTSLRFPTEGERDNNKERERKRRETTRRIYAGLRAHGNYQLRKHADNDDLLRALCEEAGWHVEKDGTIYRKTVTTVSSDRSSGQSFASGVMDICGSIDVVHSNLAPMVGGKAVKSMGKQSVNLTLSLSLPYSRLEALGAVIN